MTTARTLTLATLALVVGALGCWRPAVDLQAERRVILERDRDWSAAAAAGDLERTLSFWTEDATVLAPGGPPILGKAAIRQMVAAGFATPGFRISWQATEVVVDAGGRLAYEIATNAVTAPGLDGALATTRGNAVAVWRKDADGLWRCVVDVWNAAGPAEGLPPAAN